MASSRFLYSFLSFFLATLATVKAASLPSKIYGVNLGSWLLIEPWMLPQEWLDMGGEQCNDCYACIASEFMFARAYPKTVDATLKKHWQTWFTQTDVDTLKAAGINTVRIPLGYWIIEPLVDRKIEWYAKGGILELRRGLKQLQAAGIAVILDHHALPGVQAINQQFAGRCTNSADFYTPYNYHRALIWTAVMTALTHLDPAFAPVAGIQAVNEPIMDSRQTPGYGDFQKNFVKVIRAVEQSLGIKVPGESSSLKFNYNTNNVTTAFADASASNIYNEEVRQVLRDMVPVFAQVALQIALESDGKKLNLQTTLKNREPIVTVQQDINWQNNNPPNPADAKIGPQIYDNHLYYSFGWVADANEEAYLKHVCNLDRIEKDAALGNSPLFFGEWAISTEFPATDAFLKKWADAQKYSYGKDAGWMFWNFKIEVSEKANGTARQWSYLEGLKRGYFTQDPSKYNDPNVCVPYINGGNGTVPTNSTSGIPTPTDTTTPLPTNGTTTTTTGTATDTPAPTGTATGTATIATGESTDKPATSTTGGSTDTKPSATSTDSAPATDATTKADEDSDTPQKLVRRHKRDRTLHSSHNW
ncbi:glycoside hydrolase family 5 protein [Ephemerocybe angulata]|uniref:Glycoside hydrolase family 5 protein n=1 Tax=Ephemerocybe angulata TaxID=980116 RepID=A0A8H6M2W6_9AGAR|nr:glycoside hydrolase family 5 protein [Tulosesus angulatus]